MQNKPKTGVVVFAKNVGKVAKFYEHLFTMSVAHAEPKKIVLESESILLVIHGIPEHIADTIVITDPPELREETPIKLFLPVPCIAEARVKAAALGGKVKPVSAEWAADNFRACDGFDPEGNIVQFRENAS
jgi:predicted enzyme related to lactoylglutathione lyase